MTKRMAWGLWIGWAGIFVLIGCQPDQEKSHPLRVARVGSSDLRADELHERVRGSGLSSEQVLAQMVDEYAMAVRAKQLGLDQRPDFLRSSRNLLASLLRREVLEPAFAETDPTTEEIVEYYEQHKAIKYTRPGQRRGALLYVEAPEEHPSRREKGRRRIEKAHQEALQQGGSSDRRGFGALAVTYSEDPVTRYKGGDFGWVSDGDFPVRWPGEVMERLFSLQQPGDVSEVLETRDGFFVVKLLDGRPEKLKPFSEVQARIRQILWMERKKHLEEQFKKEVHEKVGVKIFTKNMADLELAESLKGESSSL